MPLCVRAQFVAAHEAHPLKTGLRIARDGYGVVGGRIDHDSVMTQVGAQITHEGIDRIVSVALALMGWVDVEVDPRVAVLRVGLFEVLDQSDHLSALRLDGKLMQLLVGQVTPKLGLEVFAAPPTFDLRMRPHLDHPLEVRVAYRAQFDELSRYRHLTHHWRRIYWPNLTLRKFPAVTASTFIPSSYCGTARTTTKKRGKMKQASNSGPPAETEALDEHFDFGGLAIDLPSLIGRRKALAVMGGVGLAGLLAACGSKSDSKSSALGTTSTSAASTTATTTRSNGVPPGAPPGGNLGVSNADLVDGEIPNETQGPYPADGSNGPNILKSSEIVRSDITTSIAGLTGTAEGIPATVEFTLVDATSGAPLANHAMYAWHCTATGAYSIYEVTDQNYLRGVQESDSSGKVTFQTVFPGCYNGRWPHIHFEVYESLASATTGSSAKKTSQLALPQGDCETVYADSKYGSSASNLSRQSLASDNVFSDGWQLQLATVSKSGDNYTISLLVGV